MGEEDELETISQQTGSLSVRGTAWLAWHMLSFVLVTLAVIFACAAFTTNKNGCRAHGNGFEITELIQQCRFTGENVIEIFKL